jgi:hypothetical protein
MFDTVVQTQFGSFFKAFALPTDEKPTTGVAPGSKIEEFNPVTGAVDTDRWNGESWAKIDSNGTAAGSVPAVATENKGKYLHANESTGALEWAEASGGGSGGDGVLIVHQVYDDGSWRLDATYGDIVAAPMVFLEVAHEDMGLEMDYSVFSPLLLCGLDQGYRSVTFISFSLSDGSPSLILYSASSDSDYPVLET